MLKERDKTKYIKRVASPRSLIKKVPYAGTLLAFQHLFHLPVWKKKKKRALFQFSVLVAPRAPCSSLSSSLQLSFSPPCEACLQLTGVTVCLSYLSLADLGTVESLCVAKHRVICMSWEWERGREADRGRTAGGKRREEERKRRQAQEMKKKCAKGTKDRETAL